MSDKPNLIYIYADTLRYSSLGFNSDEYAYTPNLDALASCACVLTNAVSSHPVRAPYDASLFTGKYTPSTGVVMNGLRICPEHETFASALENGGYETCYIGRWNLYSNRFSNSSSSKNSFVPMGENRLGFNGFFASFSHTDDIMSKLCYYLDTKEKIQAGKYEPDAECALAVDRIEEMSKTNKPFAMFLSLSTPREAWSKANVPENFYSLFDEIEFPNSPNESSVNDIHSDGWSKFAPGKFKNLNDMKRAYYAMTADIDRNVGKIIDTVKKFGLIDNTVIVFTSAKGEMFASHGRRGANTFYEEAVRVPFVIKWGERFSGVNGQCFSTPDIMPTLLSILGVKVPDSVEGRDESASIFLSNADDNVCLMMGTGPAAMFGDGYEWRAVRTKKYTYAKYLIDSREYLFDNENDPYQMKNLAGNKDYYHIKAVLVAKMFGRMGEVGDKFEKNAYYKKNRIKKRIVLPVDNSKK